MSSPYPPQLPPQGQPTDGWHYPTGPQSGPYPPPGPDPESGSYPVQPYQQPTYPYPVPPPYTAHQPYPAAQPYPHQQPYPPQQPPVFVVAPQMTQMTHVSVRAGGGTNHAFHLVMTLLTCGLWLIVWVVVAIANSGKG
ncbi:hypothetical protein [Saccharothrix lopnurensis]|uniref:Uncharacterized protein n=1 Tax=Saccharothrix lopnurensis TaxID=1670621 RepID=A0ABW1P6F1_9PSEU